MALQFTLKVKGSDIYILPGNQNSNGLQYVVAY